MQARLKGWVRPVWRAARAEDGRGGTRLAAALTYYALLSLFPALIILVALLSLIGQTSASQLVIGLVDQLAPPRSSVNRSLRSSPSAAAPGRSLA
jgi:membrane protein